VSGRLVVVLVLVLDTVVSIVSPIYCFDYENEDDEEDDLSQSKYLARNAITGGAFKIQNLTPRTDLISGKADHL
jgi:hypothetical protein